VSTSWASSRTGIVVTVEPVRPGLERPLAQSIGLGLRRNPKRAQLLVSSVLGKHVPVRASLCLRAGSTLAEAVRRVTDGPYDVLGFAETATGLGHQVAHGLGAAMYLHTTRRPHPDHPRRSFLEEHSHAVDQALTPPPGAFTPFHVGVLVDDEISTGRTALNAIAALHTGHSTWVLASLLDTRSDADRDWCQKRAAELGITLLEASLMTGSVTLADDSVQRAQAIAEATPLPTVLSGPGHAETLRLDTHGIKTTARYGFRRADDEALRSLAQQASELLQHLDQPLVIGDEELMYFPQLLAEQLGDALTCTTTRSPAVAIDQDGYPLRTAVAFDSISEPGRLAYSYNTADARTVLLVTEDEVDDRGVLAAFPDAHVTVLTLR
jgi:hypothetical protein